MKSGLQKSIATQVWALLLACSLLSALSAPAVQVTKERRCCAAHGCASGMNGCGMRGIPGPLPSDLGFQPFISASPGFLPPFIPPSQVAFEVARFAGNLTATRTIVPVPPELRL